MSAASGLAALLFMELAEFNEAFDRDERAALVLLSRYRDYSDPVIAEHSGEILDITGSELFVSFGSAVAATQCALHLALGLRSLLASERASGMKARMGLHLGEIWRQGGKAFGNGVNVAARVMQAAPPGSIYLSEDCYRQVDTKLDLRSREAPALEMKNISRRLALYELDWGAGFAVVPTQTRGADNGAGAVKKPAVEGADSRAMQTERSRQISLALKEAINQALARHVDIHINITPSGAGHAHSPSPAGAAKPARLPEEALPEAPLAVTAKPEHPVRKPARRTEARELELRRANAAAIVASSVKTLALTGILGAGFGYAYTRSGGVLSLLGAALLGLFPFLSALRQLVRARAELKSIEKKERRNT